MNIGNVKTTLNDWIKCATKTSRRNWTDGMSAEDTETMLKRTEKVLIYLKRMHRLGLRVRKSRSN